MEKVEITIEKRTSPAARKAGGRQKATGQIKMEMRLSDQDVSFTGGYEQRSKELLGVRVRRVSGSQILKDQWKLVNGEERKASSPS